MALSTSKYGIFGTNLPLRGKPLKRFYKILHGDGVPGPRPCAKFHRCGFKNVGINLHQIYHKILIFFYTKFGMGDEVSSSRPCAKFYLCGLKMWAD